MKTFLLRQRINQAIIPSGCTCHLQSLDLVINKPFNDAIRKEILKYIKIGLSRIILECDEEISISVLDTVEHIIDELDDTLLIDE